AAPALPCLDHVAALIQERCPEVGPRVLDPGPYAQDLHEDGLRGILTLFVRQAEAGDTRSDETWTEAGVQILPVPIRGQIRGRRATLASKGSTRYAHANLFEVRRHLCCSTAYGLYATPHPT